jgi:hypothetical protein
VSIGGKISTAAHMGERASLRIPALTICGRVMAHIPAPKACKICVLLGSMSEVVDKMGWTRSEGGPTGGQRCACESVVIEYRVRKEQRRS